MSKQCAESCNFCQHHKIEIVKSIGWSDWGPWSICDVVCGEGVRYRYVQTLGDLVIVEIS